MLRSISKFINPFFCYAVTAIHIYNLNASKNNVVHVDKLVQLNGIFSPVVNFLHLKSLRLAVINQLYFTSDEPYLKAVVSSLTL